MIGAIISFILGYACCWALSPMWEEAKQKAKCNACFAEQYERAWTLELDGQEIKMLPVYEYKGETE